MKKNNTKVTPSSPRKSLRGQPPGGLTIGIDLGDRTSRICVLDAAGEILSEESLATTQAGMTARFQKLGRCRIALEVGTHSPWVSRLLSSLGHEVYVSNARQVQLISQSSRKSDRVDARTLARLARVDPELLRPIRHRGAAAQAALAKIRVRAALVETRTGLINTARGHAKAMGSRVPACAADYIGVDELQALPPEWQRTLTPLLVTVEEITEQIRGIEAELERLAEQEYGETRRLRQVPGVGLIVALTFVLTLEDAGRFRHSRDVGCYVGLRPKRNDSGEQAPQLPITKEGDAYLRVLLVQSAHYILGRRGPDSDLKRWGLQLAARGGKNAYKRAIVAVARKLGILLHRLWVTDAEYVPLRNTTVAAAAA